MQETDRYTQRNLEAVQSNISEQELFFDTYLEQLLTNFSIEEDKTKITWAYTLARKAHGDKERQSGQLYFGHVVAVTRVLVEEYGEKNANFVTALLLHDVGEDTCALGDVYMKEMPYDIYENFFDGWKQRTTAILIPEIGEKATELFIALTRPQVNPFDISSKEQARAMNNAVLDMSPEAALLKSADVLDNIRTLKYCDIPKQNRTMALIKAYYLPLFQKHFDIARYNYIHDQIMIAFADILENQKDNETEIKEAS